MVTTRGRVKVQQAAAAVWAAMCDGDAAALRAALQAAQAVLGRGTVWAAARLADLFQHLRARVGHVRPRQLQRQLEEGVGQPGPVAWGVGE